MSRPLVSIVLAVYRPNQIFLIKQLDSIVRQAYAPIELLIRDDSADGGKTFEQLKNLVSTFPSSLVCRLFLNETNIGSTSTFERLTADASGRYIAYCDQDDIWEANKIDQLVALIEQQDAPLAYSDLAVIDGEDNLIHASFREMNKRILHLQGEGLFPFFLRRNCITGCTMLLRAEVAKAAIPFLHCFVHDHFLALYASSRGKIAYCTAPLIRYRIHGNNQIGAAMLKDIIHKQDYWTKKLVPEREKAVLLREYFKDQPNLILHIEEYSHWIDVRIAFFQKHSLANLRRVLQYLPQDKQLVLFESIMFMLPNWLFYLIIKLVTKAS